jgi:hypothetical protein
LIHVSLSVSPLRDASGKVIGASKIARDITERREVLLPFLWTTVAKDGQIYGNADIGSASNPMPSANFGSSVVLSRALSGYAMARIVYLSACIEIPDL